MRHLRKGLEALLREPVTDVGSAEVAAEAARLLRDLLRLEAQAQALLDRVAGGSAVVGVEAPAYSSASPASNVEGVTLHEAARRVLAAAGVPMHVRDLGARIKAAGWRHPRARHARPDQIDYQLAARLPRHPETFQRVAPNTFGLTAWGESTAETREKPRLGVGRGRGPKLAKRVGDEPEMIFGERPKWRSS